MKENTCSKSSLPSPKVQAALHTFTRKHPNICKSSRSRLDKTRYFSSSKSGCIFSQLLFHTKSDLHPRQRSFVAQQNHEELNLLHITPVWAISAIAYAARAQICVSKRSSTREGRRLLAAALTSTALRFPGINGSAIFRTNNLSLSKCINNLSLAKDVIHRIGILQTLISVGKLPGISNLYVMNFFSQK